MVCYRKTKGKGPNPYVVYEGRVGNRKAKANFSSINSLRKDKRFKRIKQC